MSSINEYDSEPIPGLPGIPPAGEKILWQGSPAWMSFLVHVLHVRWVLAYFGALTVWRFISAISEDMTIIQATTSAFWLMPLWSVVIVAMAAFAIAASRTTIYTITTNRLILRYGVALQMCVNIPYSKVAGAELKQHSDGTGEIPLQLDGDIRLAYLVIWPHARRGHYLNPQPMLRSLADPKAVAKILVNALAASQVGVASELGMAQPVAVRETTVRLPPAFANPLAPALARAAAE
jgi:hypothetical protein